MANFKTHLSTGIILGIICATIAVVYGITSHWTLLALLIFAVSIGSFLPDVDSDSSIPFRIVFYALGITCSIFTIFWTINSYPDQLFFIIGFPLVTFIIVRFALGSIFKKFTHHRGIFHSIPMAIVATLGTLLVLQNYSHFTSSEQLLLSIAVGIGFIGHLILDEIYAATNLNGKKFRPNKNLGSAIKLWSNSLPITFIVYIIILILFGATFTSL